ncbi:hypothetical protein AWW67_08690 [Roseivirga seohaensis]|uniref:Uncharacterized protein n=1 Tax=Roseivirga seohaensis TaxID=1914963 RepID=A0A150XQ58_9BACT|nr:hypothetical protein AWW67_08690 [Roseivirga seohaensis]
MIFWHIYWKEVGKVKNNKVKISRLWSGGNSKYQSNNMKNLGQKNISALIALFLAITIVTSVDAKSNDSNTPIFEEDLSYLEDVQEYVDAYMEPSPMVFEEAPQTVKVFDAEGNLVLQGMVSELSEEGLRIYRQADYLSSLYNTKYYRLK